MSMLSIFPGSKPPEGFTGTYCMNSSSKSCSVPKQLLCSREGGCYHTAAAAMPSSDPPCSYNHRIRELRKTSLRAVLVLLPLVWWRVSSRAASIAPHLPLTKHSDAFTPEDISSHPFYPNPRTRRASPTAPSTAKGVSNTATLPLRSFSQRCCKARSRLFPQVDQSD